MTGSSVSRLTGSIGAAPPRTTDQWAILDIELEELSSGDTTLDRLALRSDLGPREQGLELDLSSGPYRLSAKLPGAVSNLDENWRDWQWQGYLHAFRLDGPQDVLLELQEPAALELSLD